MLFCLRQPGFPGTFLSGLIWWVVSRGRRLGLQVPALEQTYLKNPAGIRTPTGSQLCQAWRKSLLKLAENGLDNPGLVWLAWWPEAGKRLRGMKGYFQEACLRLG